MGGGWWIRSCCELCVWFFLLVERGADMIFFFGSDYDIYGFQKKREQEQGAAVAEEWDKNGQPGSGDKVGVLSENGRRPEL